MEAEDTPTIPEPVDESSPAEAAREAALAAFDEAAAEAPAEPAPAPKPAEPAAAAPAAPVPTPAEVAVAERLAEIVRAESALVAKQQEIRREAEQARAEARAAAEKLAALERALDENPMEVLRARKWELEDVVKSAATKQTPEAVRIAKLEERIAARDAEAAKAAEAARVAAEQREAEQARTTLVTKLIPDQLAVFKDELPLCAAWFEPEELAREVYAVMGHEFSKTKTAPTPIEAARKVEAALRARVEKVNPSAKVTPESKPQPKPKAAVKPSSTVTNQQTQHRTVTAEPVKKGDVDGYRRAALALADDIWGSAQQA